VVSSYTPTLAALSRAQGGKRTHAPEDSNLLLIAAHEPKDQRLPKLLNIGDEIQNIVQAADKKSISWDVCAMATVEQITNKISSAQIVHIACHGVQVEKEPLKSAFCLCDGDLTISRLMELDLKNAFLAFLSACETAKGDEVQPDQTVHLAATMLFVGFKSVIATMW
jgi:CHAT domain-containing protein